MRTRFRIFYVTLHVLFFQRTARLHVHVTVRCVRYFAPVEEVQLVLQTQLSVLRLLVKFQSLHLSECLAIHLKKTTDVIVQKKIQQSVVLSRARFKMKSLHSPRW